MIISKLHLEMLKVAIKTFLRKFLERHVLDTIGNSRTLPLKDEGAVI